MWYGLRALHDELVCVAPDHLFLSQNKSGKVSTGKFQPLEQQEIHKNAGLLMGKSGVSLKWTQQLPYGKVLLDDGSVCSICDPGAMRRVESEARQDSVL